MSRTAIPYSVAPLDAFQLSVTDVPAVVGPGLDVDPGVGFDGVGGAAHNIPGHPPKIRVENNKIRMKKEGLNRALTFIMPGFCLLSLNPKFI